MLLSTSAERKRILLNNIWGVDIDAQAVEVTKLSLLLKVLEGESQETIDKQLRMLKERALPDLGSNIKCGNSLIDSDFNMNRQMGFLTNDEEFRINAFPWKQQFEAILKSGGFDVVLGNPPWVFTRDVPFGEPAKQYFADHYVGGRGKINLYALFIYRGMCLLNDNGAFSMIVPNTFLRASTYRALREHMLKNWRIQRITDAGPGVFEGVTASSVMVFATKKPSRSAIQITELSPSGTETRINQVRSTRLLANPGVIIDLFTDEQGRDLVERVRGQYQPLSDFTQHLISGIQTWKQHKSNFIAKTPLTKEYKPLLEGKDIGRYSLTFNNKYILYNKGVLNVMQDESIFLLPEKILIQRVSGGNQPLRATLDSDRHYCFNSINSLVCKGVDNRYVLGILNSKFMNWYYSLTFSNRSQLTVNIANKNLLTLPIATVQDGDEKASQNQKRLIDLVDRMLLLTKQVGSARTSHEKSSIERRIASTDEEIDPLVYALYGLAPEERNLVEAAKGTPMNCPEVGD